MADKSQNTAFNQDAVTAKDNSSVEQNDPFWDHAEIDMFRWNASYPYQLLLVKREGSRYLRDSEANKWNFTLPMGPSAINFTMPFAVNGEVNLDGYHEQWGGAPLRMISFSGTTGVLPNKGSAEVRQTSSLFAGVFAGTIQAASRTASAALSLAGVSSKPNIVSDDDLTSDDSLIGKTTGYYQFRKLQEFFENYANFKKTTKGKDYVLALAMWKDQAVYLVTPQQFAVTRTSDSPYEYPYTLGFRAWKRINLQQSGPPSNAFRPVTRDATKLGKLLKAIDDARRVLEGARDTISAVGGDLDHALFEPLRETALWVKDLLGIPVAFADLPAQIIKDAQQTIITFVGIQDAANGIPDAFKNTQDTWEQIAGLAAETNQANTQGGVEVKFPTYTTNVANAVFENPNDNYDFFSRINVAQLNLPPILVRAVVDEKARVSALTRLDFEEQRDTLVQLMADFADQVGAGHPTYAATYGRAVSTTTRTPTSQDFHVMFAMNRVILELNRLAASGETNRFQVDSLNFVAGLASRSGIAFRVPKSKFAVPFPYGMTLEQLSTRYLSNPDRWIEIASLNGLRAPYVDEVGFDLPLLTNGHDNQIEVANSANLFIGQLVWVSSPTTSRASRHIVKIDRLNSGQTLLTLDGDADLHRYTTAANANLHAFLPDTVNSMQQIYIPSADEPADQDYKMKGIPGIDWFDPLIEAAGVDLLLTESLDLAITPDGDCRLAVGLTNVIQTARIRLSTPQGTLARHPSFGLAIKPGMSTADVDAQTLLRSCRDLFSDDPTFTGVTAASVVKQGPLTSIAIQVGIQGVSQNIPISFKLKS